MPVDTVPAGPVRARLSRLAPRLRRPRVWAAAALLLAGLAVLLAWRHGAGREQGFQTVTVRRADVVASVSASGLVEPVETVNLSFKNPGTVRAVHVREGEEVREGQLLIELDEADQQAQVLSAEANLRSATARLEQLLAGNRPEEIEQARAEAEAARAARDAAEAQLKRMETLAAEGYVSAKELEDARSNYASSLSRWQQADAGLRLMTAGAREEEVAQARAAVDAARAQLLLARNNLEATRLRAPFDGMVAEVNATPGLRVTGVTVSGADSSARPLISVVSRKLRVRAQVNEADIGRVSPGQEATFTVNAYPGVTFGATVASVAPRAVTVSNVQLYDVLLEIGAPDQAHPLKAGMPCNVSIVTARKTDVPVVPRRALTFATTYAREQGLRAPRPIGPAETSAVVVVLVNGAPELRAVRTGLSDAENVEVVAGLDEGEVVAVGREGAGASQARNGTQTPSGSPLLFRRPGGTPR
ncbi:MAG: HlyD family efflux transporter periplasmic adaptor subunit [Firmicutes bacterium]|nr:HlyD family efflux transporter periplasmic adaptor subunit [Bacillota bacterium]